MDVLIIRFGTEELFNQDDPEDPESGNDIVYDDTAINQLLDRSQEGIEEKVKIIHIFSPINSQCPYNLRS
jgi:hypothetical protein